MDFKKILFYVVLFIVLFSLYRWLFRDQQTLNILDMGSAKESHTKKLKSGGASTLFAYSFWMYVSSWNHGKGQEKVIIQRDGTGDNDFCPKIALSPNVNDLEITLATLSGGGNDSENKECVIKNIPLQKWTHIAVTTNNQSIDTYVDGKLVKTCLLKGSPQINEDADIKVCPPNGTSEKGYDGFLAKLRYYSRTLNPREVYELYKEGPNKGIFGNFLNKYKLKFSYYVDNEYGGGITI